MKRAIFILCAILACASIVSCEKKHTAPWELPSGNKDPDPVTGDKEKMLWMDADESFMTNFSTKEKITALLNKIKDTGFNKIVVDVRPVEGTVLYDSEFMPPYGDSATRGWDYLQFMLDEAKKRDIKVTVSTVMFGVGFMKDANRTGTGRSQGVVWTDSKLKSLACIEYTSKGLINSMDDTQAAKDARGLPGGGFIFLNPAHPDAQDYVLRFVEEIVSKYDFDAYAFDYCRFPDQESDFSNFSRGEFETWLGEKITNWPADIFTYDSAGAMVPGKYYKQWWEWRSGIVRDFISLAGSTIRSIKPDVKIEYWAASWLSQGSGQNWASQSYNLLNDPDSGYYYGMWMNSSYRNTGFADELNTFLIGTYLSKTYEGSVSPDGTYREPPSDANSKESMEYQLKRGQRYIGNACDVYGNVVGTNPATTCGEQVYYCLKHSEGVMVFDVCHFINNPDHWTAFKNGMARYDAEVAAAATK